MTPRRLILCHFPRVLGFAFGDFPVNSSAALLRLSACLILRRKYRVIVAIAITTRMTTRTRRKSCCNQRHPCPSIQRIQMNPFPLHVKYVFRMSFVVASPCLPGKATIPHASCEHDTITLLALNATGPAHLSSCCVSFGHFAPPLTEWL